MRRGGRSQVDGVHDTGTDFAGGCGWVGGVSPFALAAW